MIRILLLTCMMTLFGCSQKAPEGAFKGYEYVENGMRAVPQAHYEVFFDDEGAPFVRHINWDGEETVMRAPKDLPAQIDSLVRGHKLHRLKDHYQPPFKVLDGVSWRLYIRYEGGSISSGGYHSRPPERLREGIEAINALLQECLAASSNP